MASAKEVKNVTGFTIGGVSPIGLLNKIDVYIENIKMFNGDLGEYKGNAAVNIKKRI